MREFKVGDLVESEDFGKGIVVKSEYHTQIYPIHVRFKGRSEIQYYTEDGRWSKLEQFPSLKHIETQNKEA